MSPRKTKSKTPSIHDVYQSYLELCESLKLIPCEFMAWQFQHIMLGENQFPYMTSYGTVWARDLTKTPEDDRPAEVLIMANLSGNAE